MASGDPRVVDDSYVNGGFLGLGFQDYKTYGLDQGAFKDPTIDANKAEINRRIGQFDARSPQQMQGTTLDRSVAQAQVPGDTRSAQMQLAQSLAAQARGQGPSLAQSQFRQATNAGLRQQLALASSSRGVNPNVALRNAAVNQAQINQNAAMQSGQLRAQERLAAQGQLGGVLSNVNQQDAALSQFNAGQSNQVNLQTNLAQGQINQQTAQTNLAAGIQQQQFADQQVQKYLAMGWTLDQAQFQANQDAAKTAYQGAIQQEAAKNGIAVQQTQQQSQAAGAAMGALATLGAGLASASDKRLKKKIDPADDDARDFLNDLVAYTYDYKSPDKHGEGRRLGIMAQDAEKSKLGRSFVFEGPDGKMLDHHKAMGAVLAGLASLNRRMSVVEDD